jgi:hypothetical protein
MLCCDAGESHAASLQVLFAFAPGVTGAIWNNISAIPVLGA